MPNFYYKARDAKGRSLEGQQEAIDIEAAIKSLINKGYFITKIDTNKQSIGKTLLLNQRRHKKVKADDLLSFARELSTLLEAGVDFLRALDILSPQLRSEKLLSAVNLIRNDISEGLTFKGALAKHPTIFPEVWLHIVEAGEVTGKLPFVLNELSSSMAAAENIKKKVTTALIYPAVLMSVALIAVICFVTKIIPVFADLFHSFDAELPGMTLAVLRLSEFVASYILLVIIIASIAGYFFRQYSKTFDGRLFCDRFLISMPIFGEMVRDSIIARLSINLSIMIKSGVNFIQSLEIAGEASGNLMYEQALLAVRLEVQEGLSLSKAMMRQSLFSSMMTQVLLVGEEIGKLDEMLLRVSEYYEARVNIAVSRVSALIEPAILVFVGLVIGFLVVAMFLPILTLSSSIG